MPKLRSDPRPRKYRGPRRSQQPAFGDIPDSHLEFSAGSTRGSRNGPEFIALREENRRRQELAIHGRPARTG